LANDEDPPPYYDIHDLPPLGTCTALYAFEGKYMTSIINYDLCYNTVFTHYTKLLNILATSEGSIPMFDGEQLLIIEQDQGDGWTRVRRQPPNVEEGFVPTSYISIHSS